MKKLIILILTIICVCCKINAQQQIDNMQLKCLYVYNYTKYTSHGERKLTDTMMLEVGSKSCKFYSYCNYIIDSIRSTLPSGAWGAFSKTGNLYTIYVNYPENKTTVIDMLDGYAEYVEDFEIPKWTIHAETQKILSHPCKKATCRYRGRDYTAWYALDIPISRGPYKFAGLPGLILKIVDTENVYSFECTGMEKSAKIMYEKTFEKKPVSVTREEFIRMLKMKYDNPQASLNQTLKETGALNADEYKDFFKGVKIPFKPIELE